jgi:hypothetical protein
MPPVVVMLDMKDRTLHLPATGEGQHLITACGVGPLDEAMVGPDIRVAALCERFCPDCWEPRHTHRPS